VVVENVAEDTAEAPKRRSETLDAPANHWMRVSERIDAPMLFDAPLKAIWQPSQRMLWGDVSEQVSEAKFRIRLGQVKMCQPVHSQKRANACCERATQSGNVKKPALMDKP
jgi:hypothetical protein